MTWVETAIETTAASSLLFLGVGIQRQLNLHKDMNNCARINLTIGLSSASICGALRLYNLYIH